MLGGGRVMLVEAEKVLGGSRYKRAKVKVDDSYSFP